MYQKPGWNLTRPMTLPRMALYVVYCMSNAPLVLTTRDPATVVKSSCFVSAALIKPHFTHAASPPSLQTTEKGFPAISDLDPQEEWVQWEELVQRTISHVSVNSAVGETPQKILGVSNMRGMFPDRGPLRGCSYEEARTSVSSLRSDMGLLWGIRRFNKAHHFYRDCMVFGAEGMMGAW